MPTPRLILALLLTALLLILRAPRTSTLSLLRPLNTPPPAMEDVPPATENTRLPLTNAPPFLLLLLLQHLQLLQHLFLYLGAPVSAPVSAPEASVPVENYSEGPIEEDNTDMTSSSDSSNDDYANY
ncbi:hypothetical protein B0T17DRAFT_512652 [Bombardia bombarda]|uniref:Uncharacterized protein n=1 Tax=Bombardia bombarda TaxID=252184 RepID=A0AA39W9L0_9PEZI|nr:hypothetical protein B0T17DRAFT_512652 [Bombardia bombarda]